MHKINTYVVHLNPVWTEGIGRLLHCECVIFIFGVNRKLLNSVNQLIIITFIDITGKAMLKDAPAQIGKELL